jgi:glycosyltransferase involved in cell wall biosynthesis
LRVLHLSISDGRGGAAIAAKRLHDALRDAGVDSAMMVITKRTDDPSVTSPLGRSGRFTRRQAQWVAKRRIRRAARAKPDAVRSLGLFGHGLGRAAAAAGADVIHLHWVGDEAMGLAEIARLPRPVVWTLHDMWAFSGAEHFSDDGRHRNGYAGGPADIDRRTWQRKARLWRGFRPHFVAPSRWMAGELATSALFGEAPCTVIPNTLDPAVFAPGPRDAARAALGLPAGPLILFGAIGGAADPRKGGDLLADALHRRAGLGHRPVLAVFGGPAPPGLPMPAIELGPIRDPARLALAYRAADVFVAPSRMDNFPSTVIEAQACGTPAVAFDIGGMPDAVGDPARLAPAFDTAALAAIMARLLDAPPDPAAIRAATLARVAPDVVVARHIALYAALLSGHAPPI